MIISLFTGLVGSALFAQSGYYIQGNVNQSFLKQQ
jgi:hypothetical protein